MTERPNHITTLLRLPEVENVTGKKRSAIYSEIQAGTFPPPVKISAGASARASAWVDSEIQAWIASRIAERDRAKGVE